VFEFNLDIRVGSEVNLDIRVGSVVHVTCMYQNF